MSSLFELVNRLAVLVVGRQPRWDTQNATTGAPTSGSSGASAQGALVSRTQIDLREDVAFKTVRIEHTGEIIGEGDYTVTINNNGVLEETGSGTKEDALEDLRDGINADATVSDIVTASVGDNDDGDPQLVLRGEAEDDYTVAVSTNLVGDELEVVHEDASTCDALIYRLPAGSNSERPGWAFYQAHESLDYRGLQIEIPIGGFSRLYCEITSADGDVTVTHGPAIEE